MTDFSEVRRRVGGIKGVMQKLNDSPPDGRWNPMTLCPFCQGKKTASVYNKGGVDYFICHQKQGANHSACCSGNRSLVETTYIAARLGLSDAKPSVGPSPAYRKLLEMADCWEEPKPPEQKPKPAPAAAPAPPVTPPTPPPETAAVPQSPPAVPNPVIPEDVKWLEVKVDEDELIITKAIELFRGELRASERFMRKHLGIGAGKAQRIMAELEKRGVVGPATGTEPRELLKLPPQPNWLIKIKIGDEITFEQLPQGAAAATPVAPAGKETTAAPAAAPAAPQAKPDDKPKLPLGLEVTRWFFGKLFPTESQMVAFLPDGAVIPDPLPEKVAKKLQYRPEPLFLKRGLTSLTCEVLGLRANPTGNESSLRDAEQQFPWDELRASGLWLESNRRLGLSRRPNSQFHGKGQIGKKPEAERKNKDDKWVWSFCQPVIIPYFDEGGEVIKLRPHKGGAPAGTISGRARIYVPRDYKACADIVEKHYTVVICEGEFKAMAIWQVLGLGAKLQKDAQGNLLVPPNFEPIGVCSLPGISYVTNVEMRMDLERWLRDVGARQVIVAFDDEDKSDKPMRQRFDAQRDARVLATELSQILHVDARVCVLPKDWRNARGKADWDGALVKILASIRNENPSTKDKYEQNIK